MSTAVLGTGDKILSLMKEMEISIPGLAALSGIQENNLLNVLAGICEPDITTACKIADALGVCVRELCPDEEQYTIPVRKGTLARQLYPKADIKISGFEKTDYPNDFFDVAVGNVPFGQYKVADKKYDKNNFLIHDYFFAKALDRVRPGGVVAFVTSKGTMDKKSPEVRKYLAQRAELLGAVRLPNTAFKENAGTEVTSDILFLKKRDRVMDIEPEWVHLTEKDGVVMNSYFADHPEMVVGKMEMVSGPYGMESTCQPDTSRPFAEQLREAVSHIDGEIEAVEFDGLAEETADTVIPADPDVKNYSHTLVDDEAYYRESSIMKPVDMTDTMQERIKGMVAVRDCTQELISLQLEEYPDTAIAEKQAELKEICLSGSGETIFLCDRNWMIEAISNLVKNALDHIGEGDCISMEWCISASILIMAAAFIRRIYTIFSSGFTGAVIRKTRRVLALGCHLQKPL